MSKDSGLRIRVERELREKFLELCRAQDRPAAQVLREFMRTYVAEHEPSNDIGGSSAKSATGKGRRG
jgi:predicted DNA-binding protein